MYSRITISPFVIYTYDNHHYETYTTCNKGVKFKCHYNMSFPFLKLYYLSFQWVKDVVADQFQPSASLHVRVSSWKIQFPATVRWGCSMTIVMNMSLNVFTTTLWQCLHLIRTKVRDLFLFSNSETYCNENLLGL